jgi:hypothetical protein
MNTKLTLTVEEGVIEKAKSYAKHTGRSLSEIVESYLETLTDDKSDLKGISPKLQSLIGIVKLPVDFDEKKELTEQLEKKYL